MSIQGHELLPHALEKELCEPLQPKPSFEPSAVLARLCGWGGCAASSKFPFVGWPLLISRAGAGIPLGCSLPNQLVCVNMATLLGEWPLIKIKLVKLWQRKVTSVVIDLHVC